MKRILRQTGFSNSGVDSDDEENPIPAYSHKSPTGNPAGPFQFWISDMIFTLIVTNIYHITTVYDEKTGSHTTLILLDTASKQRNKQTDGRGYSTMVFRITKEDNLKNSNNCWN